MIRSSLKRKLCEDGIGCELNEKHDKIVSAIVDSSLRHISLSSLFSSLEEGLEMVDMGTVLNSDNADKHRPAYLHPYDDGDLSDALKSSLVQAKAVAKTKDNEEVRMQMANSVPKNIHELTNTNPFSLIAGTKKTGGAEFGEC